MIVLKEMPQRAMTLLAVVVVVAAAAVETVLGTVAQEVDSMTWSFPWI